MAETTSAVMWFRRDLRLADNPALVEASGAGAVLPLFVLDPALWGPAGPSRRAYLGASLRSLDASLRQRGAGLSVVRGDPVRRVVLAAQAVGATRASKSNHKPNEINHLPTCHARASRQQTSLFHFIRQPTRDLRIWTNCPPLIPTHTHLQIRSMRPEHIRLRHNSLRPTPAASPR